MAIFLYSGTPGSGKSLHSAKDIIDWAKKGKPILTNFAVDLSRYPKANYSYVDDNDLTPGFLVEFSRNFFGERKLTKKDEDTILLVVDECQLVFNSRDYQRRDRKTWIKFFSTHRHLGYRVILIAQMDKMLDKQIRGLVEYEFIHRKLSNFGKLGKVISFLSGGEIFTAVQMWYPLKLKIGSSMFRAKKRYFSIYDSYGSFGLAAPPAKPVKSAQEAPANEAADSDPGEVIMDAVPVRRKRLRIVGKIQRFLQSLGRKGRYNQPRTGRNMLGWKTVIDPSSEMFIGPVNHCETCPQCIEGACISEDDCRFRPLDAVWEPEKCLVADDGAIVDDTEVA